MECESYIHYVASLNTCIYKGLVCTQGLFISTTHEGAKCPREECSSIGYIPTGGVRIDLLLLAGAMSHTLMGGWLLLHIGVWVGQLAHTGATELSAVFVCNM